MKLTKQQQEIYDGKQGEVYAKVMQTLVRYGELFGAEEEAIPAEIEDLVNARTEAKKAKNFAEADRIRDELKEKGYIVKDTPNGPQVEKI